MGFFLQESLAERTGGQLRAMHCPMSPSRQPGPRWEGPQPRRPVSLPEEQVRGHHRLGHRGSNCRRSGNCPRGLIPSWKVRGNKYIKSRAGTGSWNRMFPWLMSIRGKEEHHGQPAPFQALFSPSSYFIFPQPCKKGLLSTVQIRKPSQGCWPEVTCCWDLHLRSVWMASMGIYCLYRPFSKGCAALLLRVCWF